MNGLRNLPFGRPGVGGVDLAGLNIRRGRDHRPADYNTTRAACGLPHLVEFGRITHDPEPAGKLHDLYGTVDNIDLWVGALAEGHVPGGGVEPILRAITGDQLVRLRGGDRFWYERALSPANRLMVEQTTLGDLIRRNKALTTIQPNAVVFRPEVCGQLFADPNHNGRPDPGKQGLGGRVVKSLDVGTGDVIAAK